MSEQNNAVSRADREAGRSSDYVWPEGTFDGIIWARSLAFIADIIIIGVILLAISIVVGIFGLLTFGLALPLFSLMPLIPLAYFTITLGGPDSATPGMRWQGIELRTWDGYRPGYVQAAIQTILFYVVTFTVFLLLVPFFNYRRRCLHDYLCGTVFIRTPGFRSL
ncbi:MAG: RDD family protein [Parvibaculum sp.]|nr:RDD family protein [Parvibaculum sp.]